MDESYVCSDCTTVELLLSVRQGTFGVLHSSPAYGLTGGVQQVHGQVGIFILSLRDSHEFVGNWVELRN